jgi:hypothetical protein
MESIRQSLQAQPKNVKKLSKHQIYKSSQKTHQIYHSEQKNSQKKVCLVP